jgi:hypothetical protein
VPVFGYVRFEGELGLWHCWDHLFESDHESIEKDRES